MIIGKILNSKYWNIKITYPSLYNNVFVNLWGQLLPNISKLPQHENMIILMYKPLNKQTILSLVKCTLKADIKYIKAHKL